MDIQGTIDELKFFLEHSIAEEELLEAITSKLKMFREQYSLDKDSFTKDHIDFLKSLSPLSTYLCSFISLKEELIYVNSLKHYTFLTNQLVDIKNALHPFPIQKRVSKEIRELNERLPQIRQEDEIKQQSRLNARIIDLEQNPPRCPRKHTMVIREGRYGYFWGCSSYPTCQHTDVLNPDEKDKLYS